MITYLKYMRRLNPATKEPFKRGFVREDGKVFMTYLPNKIKRDGYCKEKWLSAEAAAKQVAAIRAHSKLWQTRQYQKQRTFIATYKLEMGCHDCGYRLHPDALDLDHRDPSQKEFTIGGKVIADEKRLLAEIAKCDVVCANCHRIRTSNRCKTRQKRLPPSGLGGILPGNELSVR